MAYCKSVCDGVGTVLMVTIIHRTSMNLGAIFAPSQTLPFYMFIIFQKSKVQL